MRATLRWLTFGAASAAGAYAVAVALARARYGTICLPAVRDEDEILERFMPTYDIVERHHICVRAPAATTFAAACEVDLRRSAVAAAIFRVRELALGGGSEPAARPRGLVEEAKAIGWGVLAEAPGEIAFGAVTQPWVASPVFRALSPDDFPRFWEPGYVKIAWTIRVDPAGAGQSIARTETRAVPTDEAARLAFRRYWSFVVPGVVVIRFVMLRLVRADAERRARAAGYPSALSSAIMTAKPPMNPSVATSVVPERTVSGMSSSTTT